MELSQYHPYGGHPDGSTRSDRISHLCFRVSVHDLLNFPPKIVARQCESDVRFEKTDLVAAVEPSSFEAQPVERRPARHPGHGVGELDLATRPALPFRSEEHTSELQSLMRISYAVFCLKKKTQSQYNHQHHIQNHTSL